LKSGAIILERLVIHTHNPNIQEAEIGKIMVLLMEPMEPVTLQGGGLQNGGSLYLAFGYQVHDVVAKKNFFWR
jgi:hypothetical protein